MFQGREKQRGGEVPKANTTLRITILLFVSLYLRPAISWAREVVDNGPDAEVKEFRFDDLRARIGTMPPGPERDYFAGELANAENHIAESIQLLSGVLPGLRQSRPDRTAIVLQTLADDYTKSFRYGEAAQTDDDLLEHFSGQLTPEQLKGTKNDSGIMHILGGAPAQTVTWEGPLKLKTERNPINSLNVDLTVNGVPGAWLLDTGANLSLVSESFAKRLGLKTLPGIAYTQAGTTGIQNPLHVGLLPTLQMGGATLHNVVLMVLPDANININLGKSSYQINAIIGYPVFQALGAISFLHTGEFVAGTTAHSNGTGARMYMKGLSPIVMCNVEGKDRPFSFDTGASGTDLFVRYYQEFGGEAKGWKKGKQKDSGAGGTIKRKIYFQPEVKLGFGDKTVVLKKVSINTTGTGTDTDELYGNLGQDVPANFDSFTLDFANMTFSLGEPLALVQSPANSGASAKLKALYDQHRWFELRETIKGHDAPPLYKGAVAAAFNETKKAEKYLRSEERRVG